IALPLTNGFIGEFLMFSGLFEYNKILAAFACISVILSAVYMLNMVQKVFFGEAGPAIRDISVNLTGVQKLVLSVMVAAILILGIYPQPVLHLTENTVAAIMMNFK
ncbi:MAG: NADH-quinone oxidoreductase subunit M, partial [Bacteroidota bacterium]|nr:NADH-quinone oxidoreductase subunit M [Bacteroidota bacterium]